MNTASEFLREPLSDELVWLFITEGCNAEEIAAYGGVTKESALAWIERVYRDVSQKSKAARAVELAHGM